MNVHASACPRCHTEIITGTTMTPGLDVVLDPAPLDPPAELEAILDRRWTYTRHTLAGQIAMRGRQTIEARPAGTRPRETVHRDHRCTDA